MSEQHWLETLAEYYDDGRQEIPQVRVDQLALVYKSESARVMARAAQRWISERTFFPQVASLRPFVQLARVDESRRSDPSTLSKPDKQALDNALLRWEQRRGTMPSDDEIAESIRQATEDLRGKQDERST